MTDAAWRAAVEDAGEAWPKVRLPAADFAAHAESCRARGGALPEHLSDLFCACAAARGDAAALRAVEHRFLPQTDVAIRGIDAAPAFTDEVRQVLRVSLLVAAGGKPPRIASYLGRGSLVAWLRVAAVRASLDLKRRQHPTLSEDEVLVELASGEPDPELRHLKELYRAEYGEALRAALSEVSGRDRVLLRLHYVEGLALARIGALYGVHESTASRWLKAAAERVAADAQRRLRQRLALSAASAESVVRMVQSGLELSISRLLADRSAPAGAP